MSFTPNTLTLIVLVDIILWPQYCSARRQLHRGGNGEGDGSFVVPTLD